MSNFFISTIKFATVIAFTFAAVSCKNSKEEPAVEGEYTAVMEITYQITDNAGKMNPVLMTVFDSESGSQEIIETNKQWSKTFTYANLPSSVGFVIEPSLNENLPDGAEVSMSYSLNCTVTLKCNDHVVDIKTVERNDELSFKSSPGIDMTDGYVFNLSIDGIKQIDYSEMINDEDETESEILPDRDTKSVNASGTLWYLSLPAEGMDEDCLHDNLLARFADKRIWNLQPLACGDYLYINSSEWDWIEVGVLAESLHNGCKIILDEVKSPQELDYFCTTYGIYNPLTGATEIEPGSLFILADSYINISGTPEDNIEGVFFALTTSDSEGGHISDYYQGIVIDNALKRLNELTANQSQNRFFNRSATDELTNLVGAKKFYINLNQTLKKAQYHKGSVASNTQTNLYSVEYDVYNIFSIDEKRNYYYIHQEFLGNFKPCYKGIYSTKVKTHGCKTKAKVCEWYADEVTLETISKQDGMIIHRNAPETTSTSTTYTSGLSWNFGGSVGYQGGGGKGDVSTGLSLSKSESYSKEDIEIANNSVPGKTLQWTYKFKHPDTSFSPIRTAGTIMKEGAQSGINTYTAGTDFIISFPDRGLNSSPVLSGWLTVKLRTTSGKAGIKCAEDYHQVSKNARIYLPALHSSDFKK